MGHHKTITATEFKAKCLDIFDQLADRTLSKVTITKRGKPVGVLVAPDDPSQSALDDLFGCMRGSVIIPEGFDLTAPVLDEPFTTMTPDRLHR